MRLLVVLPYMLICIGLATAGQWDYCFDTGNFTANSSYARNHKLLLSSLASNITLNGGFYNTSVGQDPDKVYGLALCRGDLSSEDCGSCVNSTSQEIMTACPSQKEALMWEWDITNSRCMMRYAERSFFGKLEMNVPINANYYGDNITSNLREFEQIWQPLMDSTAEKASMGSSRLKFATQEANFSIHTIYAMMQCTPDLSPTDCKLCLTRGIDEYKKCCRGRPGGRVESANCMLRFDLSPFYVPQLPSPPPSTIVEGNGGIANPTVVVIVISMIIFMVLVSVACFFLGRLKRMQIRNNQGRRYNADEIEPEEAVQFDLSTIMVATNHFSADQKLGQGGFGVVYKGTLPNGQDIAVKKLFRNAGQGETEFKNEVLLVARLQHRNLVRLMGFCYERNERLLIYEYVPNSTLDSFIFDPIKRTLLDWEMRYKIIMGVARGILYLHEDSRLRVVHRDLKASNILLNEDMNPKISDFGIARMFEKDQSQDDTSRIVGTL